MATFNLHVQTNKHFPDTELSSVCQQLVTELRTMASQLLSYQALFTEMEHCSGVGKKSPQFGVQITAPTLDSKINQVCVINFVFPCVTCQQASCFKKKYGYFNEDQQV